MQLLPQPDVRGAASPYAGGVLSGLRDSRGRPNLLVRVLALVVALLLAGPLTFAVVRLVDGVLSAVY